MIGLNDKILSKVKVRKDIYAYRLLHGGISIQGELYMFYPIKDAIRLWRHKNPIK